MQLKTILNRMVADKSLAIGSRKKEVGTVLLFFALVQAKTQNRGQSPLLEGTVPFLLPGSHGD